VEEATAGQSRADFVAKLFISLKEARETAYWLRLLTASKIGQRNEIDALATEADELRRILAATVNNTRKKGL
jgi:four helix bundle protein